LFAELDQRSSQVARALRAGGVRPGDRVLVPMVLQRLLALPEFRTTGSSTLGCLVGPPSLSYEHI